MKKSSGLLLGMMSMVFGIRAFGNSTVMAPELHVVKQPTVSRYGFTTPKSHGSVKKYQREMAKIKSRKRSKR